MNEENKAKSHMLSLDERKKLTMTGISKVISIEPELVLVVSDLGKIKITGKEMQATKLDMDKGNIDIAGNISGIIYMSDKQNAQFSLKRMFK